MNTHNLIPAASVAALALAGALPGEVLIIGIDTKVALAPEGVLKVAPEADAVLVYDISNPGQPSLQGRLPLTNSIFGPPTNLLVTPDGSRALVANSVNWVEENGEWTAPPDRAIHLLDLRTNPIQVRQTVEVGDQPSGLGMSEDGKSVVVANRKGRSATLLRLGDTLEAVHTVEIEGEAAAVAMTPDGRRALVTKFAEHAVAVLEVRDNQLHYDPDHDIAVGRWPYNVQITPNGKIALVANNGNNGFPDGHADTVTVVDLEASPPRAIDHVTVGDGPEGLAISPDGRFAAVPLLQGSAPPFEGRWFYNRKGAIALLRIDGKSVRKVATVETGAFPEGVGFSRDGRHLFVGDLADQQLSVFEVTADSLRPITTLTLPGYPASLRTQVP